MDFVTFPAGKYLIGDLCYRDVEIWDQMIDNIDGKVHTLTNGCQYAIFNTSYGDGGYFDFDRNEYWVDSGTIGIVKWDGPDMRTPSGRTFDFNSEFAVFKDKQDKGILHFGAVVIDTNPVYDEVDYEETDYALEETF